MAFDYNNAGRGTQALVISFIVAAILQVALAPQVALFGGRINFMLAFVAASSLGTDSKTMVYVGFGAGMLYDLTSPVPIGLMTLLLTLLAYGMSLLGRGVAGGFGFDALRLVCVGVFAASLINAVALVLIGVEGNILVSLGSHAISSSLLTIIASLPFLLLSGGGSGPSRGFGRGASSLSGSRYKSLR